MSNESSQKLFVGNLPFEVNDADLITVFSVVGKVKSANVVINRKTGRSKGFAFVEMDTPELTQEAIVKFEGATLNERALTVQLATPKQESAEKAESAKVDAASTESTTAPEPAAPETPTA